MNMVYFIGEDFAFEADADEVTRLLNLVLDGDDDSFATGLTKFPNKQIAECVDLMSWECDAFLINMINFIETEGRFAINHGKIKFGVSNDPDEARFALLNEEF